MQSGNVSAGHGRSDFALAALKGLTSDTNHEGPPDIVASIGKTPDKANGAIGLGVMRLIDL